MRSAIVSVLRVMLSLLSTAYAADTKSIFFLFFLFLFYFFLYFFLESAVEPAASPFYGRSRGIRIFTRNVVYKMKNSAYSRARGFTNHR